MRESFDDERPINIFLGARVVAQPKHFEILEVLKVVDLVEVANIILPQIKLLYP